jgi:hypothetical protein
MQTRALLPPYKGSTFRGVFGHALKRVVCALKRQNCDACLLRKSCLYPAVFETAALPHPFVIEPPRDKKTEYAPGETFTCNLLLFGAFNHKLPYFVYAFEQMGRIGIGKKLEGGRGRYRLEEVRSGHSRIYCARDQKLKTMTDVREISLEDSEAVSADDRRLEVSLETPMRAKFKGRLADGLPFHVLVRGMLRRVSSLMNAYGSGEPALDYRGLVEQARAVRVVRSALRWQDWDRYSNRQNRHMLMGGITGSIVYAGRLKPYLPLLETCSELHVGKQTAFGLGKIEVGANIG